jgi:hypothetical protein
MKIAIWSEGRWALGRIHDSIKKYISGHEIHVFDWMHPTENTLFFQTWQSYDLILGNTAITFLPKDTGYFKEMPDLFLAKCLAFLHCPVIDDPSGFHTEKIVSKAPTYIAVSKEAQESLQALGLKSAYVPFGVDTSLFFEPAKRRPLKRAGFVGRGSVVKNDTLFREICARSGLEPVILFGREPKDLYTDIDILINCSSFECGPLGNFEAAAMGRPVLSKKVGNWATLKTAIFYETLEDAVRLFQTMTDEDWYSYAQMLQTEVLDSWTNKHLIQTYLQPILDSFGTAYDFVEIGSCDYDTLCDPLKKGLLVEPLDLVTKNLTNTVEAVAIYEGPEPFVPLYYTTHHHDWRRGCNKILEPHPSVPYTHVRYVPTMSWSYLLKKHKITYIDILKVTTEGYESILVPAIIQSIKQGLKIRKLYLLWNELVSKSIQPLIDLESLGYTVFDTGTSLICERKFAM